VILQAQPTRARARASTEDLARLREISAVVRRAARFLIGEKRTTLSQTDLEAVGMLAIWRKLPSFDADRTAFDRWAFYQALHAMIDVSRKAHQQTLFEAALRRGVQGRVTEDERPAESDFHGDTPETDLGRLQTRTHGSAFSGWLQTTLESLDAGPLVERTLAATEAVRAVHEEIARLSDEQRTHLHLRFWDDAEVKEAAERLSTSERTLRRRWTETRDLLEARLRARGISGIPEGFGEAADALALARETPR